MQRSFSWTALGAVLLGLVGGCGGPEGGPGPCPSLSGVVEDEVGRPVPGVRVEVYPARLLLGPRGPERTSAGLDPLFAPPRSLASARTGPDGRFTVEGLDPVRDVRLVAHAPRRCGRERTLFAPSRDAGRLGLRVGAGHAVRGRVLDAAGRGVRAWVAATLVPADLPSSWYAVRRRSPWVSSTVETDGEGRFAIPDAPTGCCAFEVLVPGRAERRGERRSVPRDDEVVLRVSEEGGPSFEGRVTDPEGAPIAGARVAVTTGPAEAHRSDLESTALATTDAEGHYRVEGLLPGLVRSVAADAPGSLPSEAPGAVYASGWHRNREARAGERLVCDLVLAHASALDGRVLDPQGRPLAGARVHATGQARSLALWSAPTDGEGRWRVVGLGPGAVDLVVVPADGSLRERLPRAVEIDEPGTVARCEVWLALRGAIEGMVRDGEGRAVAGAEVVAWSSSLDLHARGVGADAPAVASTDARGGFRLPGLLPADDWRVRATAPGRLSEEHPPVVVRADAPPEPVNLVLHPTGRIEGRVVDATGAPVAGAEVELLLPPHADATTDADGRFALDGLPAGRHEIQTGGGPGHLNEPVTLAVDLAWGEVVADAVLVAATLLPLDGTVRDPEGRPVPGAWVSLERDLPRTMPDRWIADEEFQGWWARADERGRFRFHRVPAGRYRVRPAPREGDAFVRAGATGLDLVLPPPEPERFLEGTIVGPEGQPLEGVLLVRSGTLHAGGVEMEAVRGGWFRIPIGGRRAVDLSIETGPLADLAGRRVDALRREVPWAEASEGPVEVRLEAAGLVAGRVVGEDGAPVGGVRVTASGPDGADPPVRRSVESGLGGAFRLHDLPRGIHHLAADGRGPWTSADPIPTETGRGDAVLVLPRGLVIEGRVLDEEGRPVRGAAVEADGRTTHARADGRFRVVGLRPGAATLRVGLPAADGGSAGVGWPYLVEEAQGDPRTGEEIVVRLRAGAWIRGEIVLPGRPARGSITIEASAVEPQRGAYAESAVVRRGRTGFAIGPLQPGRYLLEASESMTLDESEPIEVTAPAAAVRFPVGTRRAPHPLEGRLVGEDAVEFIVEWIPLAEGGGEKGWTRTAIDGSFAVSLSSDGPFVLHAYRGDDDRCALVEGVRPSAGPLEVPLVAGGTLAGRVEGLPTPGPDAAPPSVELWVEDGRGIVRHMKVLPDGTFLLRGLPPARWRLVGYAWTSTVRYEVVPGVEAESGATGVVVGFAAR